MAKVARAITPPITQPSAPVEVSVSRIAATMMAATRPPTISDHATAWVIVPPMREGFPASSTGVVTKGERGRPQTVQCPTTPRRTTGAS